MSEYNEIHKQPGGNVRPDKSKTKFLKAEKVLLFILSFGILTVCHLAAILCNYSVIMDAI